MNEEDEYYSMNRFVQIGYRLGWAVARSTDRNRLSQNTLGAYCMMGLNTLTAWLECTERYKDIWGFFLSLIWFAYNFLRGSIYMFILHEWRWNE